MVLIEKKEDRGPQVYVAEFLFLDFLKGLHYLKIIIKINIEKVY